MESAEGSRDEWEMLAPTRNARPLHQPEPRSQCEGPAGADTPLLEGESSTALGAVGIELPALAGVVFDICSFNGAGGALLAGALSQSETPTTEKSNSSTPAAARALSRARLRRGAALLASPASSRSDARKGQGSAVDCLAASSGGAGMLLCPEALSPANGASAAASELTVVNRRARFFCRQRRITASSSFGRSGRSLRGRRGARVSTRLMSSVVLSPRKGRSPVSSR
jgi:hypothetical protein